MTFLVGDGVMPSNEGRGYVLRRIIRRAVQQARSIGLDDLYRVTDVVVEQMADAYPELEEQRERIRDAVRAEEERFEETLARGMKLFEEIAARGDISGRDAFDLTATYGFPFELTTRARARARARGRRGRLSRPHGRAPRDLAQRTGPRRRRARRAADRLRRLRADGGADRDHGAERAPRRAVRGEARALAVLPRGRRPGQRRRASSSTRRPACAPSCVRASRVGDDQVLTFAGPGREGLRRRRPRARGRAVVGALPDDGEPHRDPPPARVAPARARRPRQAGRLGGAARTSCASTSRTTARSREEERDAGRASSSTSRSSRRPGACLRDADRGGAEARRADAVRREVRRHRARARDRGLLARALRRHARPLDGRDRPVRDPLRGARSARAPGGSRPSPPARRSRSCAGARRRRLRCARELERARKEAKKPAKATEAEYEIVRQAKQGDVEVLVVEVRSGDPLEVSDRLKQQFAPAAVIVGLRQNGPGPARRQRRQVARGARCPRGQRRARGGRADRRRRRRPADDGARRRQAAGGARRGAVDGGAPDRRLALLKVLALDYGLARTGVAVSDETGTLARPLTVVEQAASEAGLRRLAELVAAEGVERVVVGLPLTLRGEAGDQAEETDALPRGVAGRSRRAGGELRRTLHDDARVAVARRRAPPRTRGRRRTCSRATSPGRREPRLMARASAQRIGWPAAARRRRASSSRSSGSPPGSATRTLGRLLEEAAEPPPATTAAVVPRLPVLRVVFPEGFTRKEMVARVAAVRQIAKQKRKITPRLTADAYAVATKAAKPPRAVPAARAGNRGLPLPGDVRVHPEDAEP